jgi:hypothetical protein
MQTAISPKAKVWIYLSPRALSAEEQTWLQAQAQAFVQQWTSHQQALLAHAQVLESRFLVLAVDEAQAQASGCSIDKSVAFVRQMGQALGIDFFDRLCFAYRNAQGQICTVSSADFAQLYQKGEITDQTIVFNTLVNTVEALQTQLEVPLAQSWHKNFV